MSENDQELSDFDIAFDRVVELGNRLVEQDEEADSWDVAAGLLAGAIQFWLYSRQPCDDPMCESCAEIKTANQRLRMLLDDSKSYAEESEYFHSPNDLDVGKA